MAYALKRAGHVVLGYAPPADRSSVAALRNYADQRNVDLFVSGRSIETADGWDLSLRFRGADGKAVGQPLKFHADSLRGMLIELKSEGPSKLASALRGGAPSAVAELPPGRALPLPTKRVARSKAKLDRPVLPGAAAEAGPAAEAPARTAPAEVDLDAAVAAAAARPETWDADGDEAPARPAPRPRRAAPEEPAPARATKKSASQRLATGGMFGSGAPADRRRGGVELDAATRSALGEGPKSKARPVLDEPAAEAASDPLTDPAAPPETAAAELEGTSFDADADDPPAPSAEEPEAKPRKKGGLFAGRLRRKSPSSDSGSATASEESAGSATLEDRDTSGGEPGVRPAPPHAVLGAQAGFLRRSLAYAVGDVANAVGVLGRQIGGLRTLRDYPGSGRDPLQPVPPAQQREALDVIARGLFAADSLVISPALQRRLAPDFEERSDAVFSGESGVATDFSLSQRVLSVQRTSLGQLMSDAVASRIVDSQDKTAKAVDAFQLAELYGRLQREIWSELASRSDIAPARRELQREHVNRLATAALRPGAASRADVRSLLRTQAQTLLAQIQTALGKRIYGADTQAHLQDSADTLSQALSARLQRAGV